MTFDIFAEQTPLDSARGYSPHLSGDTSFTSDRAGNTEQTPIVNGEQPRLPRISREHLTPAGNLSQVAPAATLSATDERRDDVALARDRRLELLIRQSEKATTVEDDARLLILTQRLRRLAPSVPERAWELLAATTTKLEEASGNLDAIRAQFAIP